MMPKTKPVKWTRDHLLIAMNLYCKIPFGGLDSRNAVIKQVAGRLGRTPNSLAMKLVNFASLDPVLKARGIRGLRGASAADRQLWDEFQTNRAELAPKSEQMLHDLIVKDPELEVDLLRPEQIGFERTWIGPTHAEALVKVRRGQQFFRQTVLSAYEIRCCISGINVPALLIASHIKPWRDFPNERLNPSNGLCLSSLHDRAFDSGLITLDREFRLVLSKNLKSHFPQGTLEQNFVPFEGKPIRLPVKLAEPSQDSLAYHRENLFH